MFNKKLKNIFIIFLLSLMIFFFSNKAAAQQEPIFNFSLNFQKLIKDFLGRFIALDKDNFYKEKYYELLQELAKLKLSLKQIKDTEIISQKDKYLPAFIAANILKVDSLGYIYVENQKVKENAIAVDKNWVLVGKVSKITKDYLIINSLNVPGIEFNVANIDGELLGLAKTISNGFIEINYVKSDSPIKINDFVLTYGGDIFPSGFLVGTVKKINKTQFGQQVIVQLLFDIDQGTLYLVK
jgi:cell shape-determining protein MreC